MARYTGPKTKIARKFGEPIFGSDKAFEKEITLLGSMVSLNEEVKNLSTQFSLWKNKKPNLLMGF